MRGVLNPVRTSRSFPHYPHMMPTLRTLTSVVILIATLAHAQNLPDEIDLSPDGRMLMTGGNTSSGFYREDTLRTIELTFSQTDWWTQLTNNYNSQTPIQATMTYNGNTYTNVGVRFKGSTSYNMLPPGSQKKSFDIDMNYFVSGQDVGGYTTINLNNSFQDDSFMREVVYEHFNREHIPAAKANFVVLVINGENWGVYLNVQGLNDAFIGEWWYSDNGDRWRADVPPGSPGSPGWGDGTAALNYLGADTTDYQAYYTLQNANSLAPWDHLVKVCDELNNTPLADLEDTLDKYMNLDRVLWHMAHENAFADDDSYIFKGKMDYSLYWEPESGRVTTQEYDGNTVLDNGNLNWTPFYHQSNVNYPLLNRLLAVPELRQRYLAHLRTIVNEELDATAFNDLVDTYKALIDTAVQSDTKKLMTYAEFTSGVTALKNNRTARVNTLNADSEMAQVPPTISGTEHIVDAGVNAQPGENETVDVRTTVGSTSGISAVTLYYSTTLWGRFVRVGMLDDGAHNDGGPGDGTYGASIPGVNGGTWVRYYIEAAANNTAHTVTYDPVGAEHNVYVYNVAIPTAPSTGVVINEVMPDNNSTATDEAGQYEDWIELHNNTPTSVNLGLWFVSDSWFEPYKWRLPVGTSIPGNGYLIVWCDEDEGQGDEHTNFKLNDQNESVLLLNADSMLVDETSWTDMPEDQGWARVPNGSGPFVVQDPTFAGNNDFASVIEPSGAGSFGLYPNPASTALWLTTGAIGPIDLLVTDATGRILTNGTLKNALMLDVSTWAAGSYTVRAGSTAKKFMVVR